MILRRNLVLYILQLTIKSLIRTPYITIFILFFLSIAMAVFFACLYVMQHSNHNPLAHKNEQIFAVQLDAWDRRQAFHGTTGMSWKLTYQDANALLQSEIPKYSVVMYASGAELDLEKDVQGRELLSARVTNAEFFKLFDVPFLFGKPWQASDFKDDLMPIVLNKRQNDRLFAGNNSIGEVVYYGQYTAKVVGVTNNWHPRPKVHDLTYGPYGIWDEIYIPFQFAIKEQLPAFGKAQTWQDRASLRTYQDVLNSELTWLLFWVELSSRESKVAYQKYLENYIVGQKVKGRFQRPLNYALSTPKQWLEKNQVLSYDLWILFALSVLFLIVAMVNMAVLLNSKVLKYRQEISLRKALGAANAILVSQQLFEILIIGLISGVIAIFLSMIILANLSSFSPDFEFNQAITEGQFFTAMLLALLIALLSGLAAIVRVIFTPMSVRLKSL